MKPRKCPSQFESTEDPDVQTGALPSAWTQCPLWESFPLTAESTKTAPSHRAFTGRDDKVRKHLAMRALSG